jgi:phospholipase D1/2
MDAYVSEELYIHSKDKIADDRVLVCGSANLNDRSQLGYHDSEIAVVIEDPTPLASMMNGHPFVAGKMAATLRRVLFRKHLGMVPGQDYSRTQPNFEPPSVPNEYDYGSAEDMAVQDPMSEGFWALWNGVARTNTEAFGKAFHPVPHDGVRNWRSYDDWYEKFFKEGYGDPETSSLSLTKTISRGGGAREAKVKTPARYKWGHVVREEFSPGAQGVRELKELLGRVRGNLVEMPLLFLIEEDIAKEGLSLNAWTEDVYT